MRRGEVQKIVIADLRGGRNDTDPPLSLRADQCTEMLNVDWKDTQFARKRGGATAIGMTGGTAFNGTVIDFLFRHVPGSSEAAAELWAWDQDGAPLKRLTGGTTWADVTLDDAAGSDIYEAQAASLNGKLFLAYNTSVDRLHVYDPNLSSARVRRVGFATPAAPTAADTGAGAYAAVLRYYRVRWIQVSGSVLIRRSEAGASVSFTPSGAGTAARVTQPTPPGEGETHWEVEASTDNATFYSIIGFAAGNHVAIATTFVDNSSATTTYASAALSDTAGMHSRFPSVKYLLTDGNRLLGAGAWESSGAESGGKSSRVWFTPVLGSADKGDDERLVNQTNQKNWVDLNEKDGGAITALGGPINGIVVVFKYRQVWKLRPTGDVSTPYLPRKMRDDVGCIGQRSVVIGEDQTGRPALYFMSHRGPYRITFDGEVEYLGRDNEVTWRSIDLSSLRPPISVFYPDLHQWWVWCDTGGGDNAADLKMMFDVQKGFPDEHGQIRGGWAKHTGTTGATTAACLFANTLGASMSIDLKPHVVSSTTVLKCDTSALDDNGTDFQAYVDPRPLVLSQDLGRKVGMAEPYLLAKALSGVTLTLTTTRDFGLETRTHTALLTASASETRVIKKFEGAEVGEADVIHLRLGDGAAQEGAWTADQLVVPVVPQEAK